MQILCTICSDIINQAENIYVTKCGHVFHFHCLSQWIERSKSCPQCRNKVTHKCMFRLYPTISSENTGDDAATLLSRLDDANLQLRQQGVKVKESEDKLEKLKLDLKQNEELIKSYEKKLVSRESAIDGLKEHLEYVKIQNRETQKLREENECLNKNIQLLNGLQKVLNATSEEVEQMLKGHTDVRTVATFATALKKALWESESNKNETRQRLHATKEELSTQKKKCAELIYELGQTRDKLIHLRRKYKAVTKRKCEKNEEEIDQMSVDENINESTERVLSENNGNIWIDNKNNESVNLMINKIENSDSPYLNLKQSSLALSTLQRGNNLTLDKFKPTERITVSKINRPTKTHAVSISIFNKKEAMHIDTKETASKSTFDTSYDGLGGHSKLDKFPEKTERPLKSCIPKLTMKHKLKRPTPTGSQDIGTVLKKLKDK